MAPSPFLFVYGTLLSGLRDDLLRRVRARFVGTGTIEGKLYNLGPYPGAKLSRNSTDRVRGEVHRLPNPEQSLGVLDEYEGISTIAKLGSEFARNIVQVTLEDGRELKAWAYLYNRPVDEARLILGGDYRNRDGASQLEQDLNPRIEFLTESK